MRFLASWTPSLPEPCPSDAQAAAYLAGRAGAMGLRHFPDIIGESKTNQGELIGQSPPHTVKRAGPSAPRANSRLRQPTRPCAPHPATPRSGNKGDALQGQGDAAASSSSHHAHTPPCTGKAKATLPNCFAFASPEQPDGLVPTGAAVSKLGCGRKATSFPSPRSWIRCGRNACAVCFTWKSVVLQKNAKLILLPFSGCMPVLPYLRVTSQHAVPDGCRPITRLHRLRDATFSCFQSGFMLATLYQLKQLIFLCWIKASPLPVAVQQPGVLKWHVPAIPSCSGSPCETRRSSL